MFESSAAEDKTCKTVVRNKYLKNALDLTPPCVYIWAILHEILCAKQPEPFPFYKPSKLVGTDRYGITSGHLIFGQDERGHTFFQA